MWILKSFFKRVALFRRGELDAFSKGRDLNE